MNRPFNKKRFWLIIAILALVEALVCYVVLQREYIFPSEEVSEVYTRYADDESIDASFIKGYRVNDTLFVDVTLLQAKDSACWERLVEDFGLTESVRVIPDKPSIIVRRVSKDNPYQGIQAPDEPFDNLVAVPDRREVHLYCTENEQQSLDLYMHLILKYMTTSKTQNITKQ